MKRSVGLVVVTEIDGLGRVAVLQRRGEFNHETMKSESYPGGCQVTAHGGVEEGESFSQALNREIIEELSENFYMITRSNMTDIAVMQELVRLEETDREVVTYGAKLPAYFLGGIRLSPSSGGLVLLAEPEVKKVKNLKDFDRNEGVLDRKVIAMFPDAREAVCKAFEVFK